MKRFIYLFYWYLRFSYAWIIGVVMFYAFLYTSSIYKPYVFFLSTFNTSYELIWLRFSNYDYMLLFFSALFIAAILFSYDYEQGYIYIPFTARYRASTVYVCKISVILFLTVVPYILAKLVSVYFSEPAIVKSMLPAVSIEILRLTVYQLLYMLYVLGFIIPGALIIRRLGYTIIFYTIYFILFEGPLSIRGSILQLFYLHTYFYIMNDPLDTFSRYNYLMIASLIAYVISYIVYSKLEVKT